MSPHKPRSIKVHTRIYGSSGYSGFEQRLREEFEDFFYIDEISDDDESGDLDTFLDSIVAALAEYSVAIVKDQLRPTYKEQREDLHELAETLRELDERLFFGHLPPDALPLLDEQLVRQGGPNRTGKNLSWTGTARLLRPKLQRLRDAILAVDLPDVPHTTKPRKMARDEILLPQLLALFDAHISPKEEEVEFIRSVFRAGGLELELPPSLPRLIAEVRQRMREGNSQP